MDFFRIATVKGKSFFAALFRKVFLNLVVGIELDAEFHAARSVPVDNAVYFYRFSRSYKYCLVQDRFVRKKAVAEQDDVPYVKKVMRKATVGQTIQKYDAGFC